MVRCQEIKLFFKIRICMDVLTIPVLNEFIEYFEKFRTYIISIAVITVGMLGIGTYWYLSHVKYEQAAQQALSEVLAEYNRAYESPELWQDVEVGAKTGYRQYGRSSLAPFFLGLQSDALLQQDKQDEALALMNDMTAKLSHRSPFYYLYQIKLARIKLHSDQEDTQKEGLQQLTSLAQDQKNPQQDEALYYLGLHYDAQDQQDKAQEIWQQLKQLQEQYKEKDVVSPWALLAEQKAK